MKQVYIDRKEVLKRIKENRKNHRDLFFKAQKGYKKAVIKELNEMLKDARENRSVQHRIDLVMPQDHTGDYDVVIDMLEMSISDSIELAQHEFQNYVRDKWEWSDFANVTNSVYASMV